MDLSKWSFAIFMSSYVFSQSWEMTIGEHRSLTIAKQETIHVSRKGIVDLNPLGDGRWQLTALKKGFVIVSYFGESLERKRISIQVANPMTSLIPPWICKHKSFTCRHSLGEVSGEISSDLLFYRAKKACLKRTSCLFSSTLNDKARRNVYLRLQKKLGADVHWDIESNGDAIGIVSCGPQRKRLSALNRNLEKISFKSSIYLRCALKASKQFLLSTRVIMIKEGTAEELGLSHLQSFADYQKNAWSLIKEQWRMHSGDLSNRVVGAPTLQLSLGAEAQSHSGGEMPYIRTHTKGRKHPPSAIQWKSFGLNQKVEAIRDSLNRVTLRFQIDLKVPTGAGKQFSHHKLSSQVSLPFGSPQLIGDIRHVNEVETQDSIPFLSQIPIIAPMVKLTVKKRIHAKLVVFFEARRMEPSDLESVQDFSEEELVEEAKLTIKSLGRILPNRNL